MWFGRFVLTKSKKSLLMFNEVYGPMKDALASWPEKRKSKEEVRGYYGKNLNSWTMGVLGTETMAGSQGIRTGAPVWM